MKGGVGSSFFILARKMGRTLTPMRRLLILLAVLSAGGLAQTLTPQQALERLFTQPPARPEWFTPEFIAQVPAAQIDAIVKQLTRTLGAYQRVRPDGQNFVVEFEKGTVPAQIALDPQGRVAGLFFRPPQPKAVLTPEQAVDQFRSLPGQTSVLVAEDGKPKVSLNPDAPLAIGSAFKLAVLEALQEQIQAGQRKWSDTVPLKAEWKSLPSGTLQNEPDGKPISLEQYATQMISLSDNTAADSLLNIVGRASVERLTDRNRPFLSTREAFILKNPANNDVLERFRKADPAGKTALLPEIDKLALPGVDLFAGGPVAIDVEWFFSAAELCGLMDKVQALPLMSINPGLANPADWQKVAFKGGSEPGVLNLTSYLVAKNGKRYCVSATWNNPQAALDENQFYLLYSGLLAGLK